MFKRRDAGGQGQVVVSVAIALTALLGRGALTIEVGRLRIAAQVAQDVADAAVLGAGAESPEAWAAMPWRPRPDCGRYGR